MPAKVRWGQGKEQGERKEEEEENSSSPSSHGLSGVGFGSIRPVCGAGVWDEGVVVVAAVSGGLVQFHKELLPELEVLATAHRGLILAVVQGQLREGRPIHHERQHVSQEAWGQEAEREEGK